MTRFLKWTALTALLALIVACCPCRKVAAKKTPDTPLAYTTWQLVQLNGRSVAPKPDQFTITFGEGNSLSGRGSCNRLMGQYQTTPQRGLTISGLASTRMACMEGADLEDIFSRMLSDATHYEIDGTMLMILTDGDLRGVLQAQ